MGGYLLTECRLVVEMLTYKLVDGDGQNLAPEVGAQTDGAALLAVLLGQGAVVGRYHCKHSIYTHTACPMMDTFATNGVHSSEYLYLSCHHICIWLSKLKV